MPPIPVIDLFAGPGGLSEGFARYSPQIRNPKSAIRNPFTIALSIEKDPQAHQTLRLRSFFHQFPPSKAPEQYYDHLRGTLPLKDLYDFFPQQAATAARRAWQAELGPTPAAEVDARIREALAGAKRWALIGGPPCQAYSVIGRSRVGGIDPKDHRVHLYKEYLRILAVHRPPVLVMENVRGILSSRLDGELIFPKILNDLQQPQRAVKESIGRGKPKDTAYRIASLVTPECETLFGNEASENPTDYLIRSEHYGIPQARHRVILLGIRDDLTCGHLRILPQQPLVPLKAVLKGMPRIRSGVSRGGDSAERWREIILQATQKRWFEKAFAESNGKLPGGITDTATEFRLPGGGTRGGEFIECAPRIDYEPDWYLDKRFDGVCNHTSRSHLPLDLHRYLFAACFARTEGRSPDLTELPRELLPNHKNVDRAFKEGCFNDRFRVQLSELPSTTITSHIAKDGHYYIHYDPLQCRSMHAFEGRIDVLVRDISPQRRRSEGAN